MEFTAKEGRLQGESKECKQEEVRMDFTVKEA